MKKSEHAPSPDRRPRACHVRGFHVESRRGVPSDPETVRVGTWNTEWAKPGCVRGKRVRPALAAPECDIVCVTEGYAGILPNRGHVIDAGPDWGYPIDDERRKVLLWSNQPWTDVDTVGSAELPSGRFVAGVTETPIGPLRVVGVCIPWRDAHVRSGGRDRAAWEDHLAWLAAFESLSYRRATSRTIVLGDFNQRIPRKRVPKKVHEELLRVFEPVEFATAGELPGAPGRAIDHIAHTPDLTAGRFGLWPQRDNEGNPRSDHFGIWCDLTGDD